MNRLQKGLHNQAKKAGFDLIFPKALLVQNLAVIINQVRHAAGIA
jgi:hypothetical protein